MQRLSMLTAFILCGIGFTFATTAHAQTTIPACVDFTCMAGVSGYGTSGGAACAPSLSRYLSYAVYDEEGFDAPLTAVERYLYMAECPGVVPVNSAVQSFIAFDSWWYNVP